MSHARSRQEAVRRTRGRLRFGVPGAVLAAIVLGAGAASAIAITMSSSDSSSPTGGYPWSDAACVAGTVDGTLSNSHPGLVCPNDDWAVGGQVNNPVTGYGYRNCTDYVAWKLSDALHVRIPHTLGNASDWGSPAASRQLGSRPDSHPTVGAIAWEPGGDHVAYVESVSPDLGTVTISEYNEQFLKSNAAHPNGELTWGAGMYDTRTVTASSFEYIHVASATTPSEGSTANTTTHATGPTTAAMASSSTANSAAQLCSTLTSIAVALQPGVTLDPGSGLIDPVLLGAENSVGVLGLKFVPPVHVNWQIACQWTDGLGSVPVQVNIGEMNRAFNADDLAVYAAADTHPTPASGVGDWAQESYADGNELTFGIGTILLQIRSADEQWGPVINAAHNLITVLQRQGMVSTHTTTPATSPTSAAAAAPRRGARVSAPVAALLGSYESIWQDAVSAHDEPSYTAWRNRLTSLATTDYLATKTLAPGVQCSTNCLPYPAEAAEAFSNGWSVRAATNGCTWSTEVTPTPTSGIVTCSLTDTVVNTKTGAPIPSSSLPFGWTHTGNVGPTQVRVLDKNGAWRVAGDYTGQAG